VLVQPNGLGAPLKPILRLEAVRLRARKDPASLGKEPARRASARDVPEQNPPNSKRGFASLFYERSFTDSVSSQR